MTIDAAILFCEQTAERMYDEVQFKSVEQNNLKEIAEYLRELKAYKNHYHSYYIPKYVREKEL